MKKIISTLLVATMLSTQVAFARETKFFPDTELPTTDFSQMVYEPVSDEKTVEITNQISQLLQKPVNEANKKQLLTLLEGLSSELAHADTLVNLAYIIQSKNNTEENTKITESDTLTMSSISQYMQNISIEVAHSNYRDVLVEYLGGEDEVEELEKSILSDRFFELQAEESAIVSEYYANELGSQTITDKYGNELYLSDIQTKIFESADDDDELNYYNDLYIEYIKQANAVLGEIYIRLVNIHNEMATEAGYDSYADYAYKNFFYRDYTPDESISFGNNVKQSITPIYKELSEYSASLYNSDIQFTDEEIISTVGTYVNEISSELGTSFEYIQNRNLLDFSASPEKISPGSAYTSYLRDYKTPYVFCSSVENNIKWNFTTLVHEFGHFNSMLHDSAPLNTKLSFSNESYDACEVHSQGLELLMTHYYPEIFGVDSSAEEIATVLKMLGSIQDGCIYNELELYAHSTPNITLDDLNRKFRTIAEGYGSQFSTDGDMGYGWVNISHMFTSAFYYISYATSAYAALEIWAEAQKGYDNATDKYLEFSSKGANVDFKKVVEEADLDDVFSIESATHLSNAINEKFILKYTDVNNEDWYFPYVFATANYITPNSSVVYGVDDNAKRGIIKSALDTTYGSDEVNDIFLGYENGDLGLEDDVTREQAVTLLFRLSDDDASNIELSYDDTADISDWAIDAIAWAEETGIVQGYDDNTFCPQGNITKAEFATILYNFMCYMG